MSQQGTIVMEGTFDEYNLQELLEVTSLCRQLIQVTLFNATIPQGLILMKAGKVLDVKLGNGEKGLLAFARLLNHTFEAFKVLKFKSKGLNLPNPLGCLIDLLDPSPSDTVRFSLPKEGFSSDVQEGEELAELDLVQTLNTKKPVSTAEDDKQTATEPTRRPSKLTKNDHSEKIEQADQKVAKGTTNKEAVSLSLGTNPFKLAKPLGSSAPKPLFPEKSFTPQSQGSSKIGLNPLSEEVHKVVLDSQQEISNLGHNLKAIQQEFETLQRGIQQIQVIHSSIEQLHHQQEGYQQINKTLPQLIEYTQQSSQHQQQAFQQILQHSHQVDQNLAKLKSDLAQIHLNINQLLSQDQNLSNVVSQVPLQTSAPVLDHQVIMELVKGGEEKRFGHITPMMIVSLFIQILSLAVIIVVAVRQFL